MNIRRMLPIGTYMRNCIVCGYPITAKSRELTAHELACLGILDKLKEEDKDDTR